LNDDAIMAAIYICETVVVIYDFLLALDRRWNEPTPKRCRIAQDSLRHHENYDATQVIPELLVEPEELSFDDSMPNFGPETFG
jgi:hypothetical protein